MYNLNNLSAATNGSLKTSKLVVFGHQNQVLTALPWQGHPQTQLELCKNQKSPAKTSVVFFPTDIKKENPSKA